MKETQASQQMDDPNIIRELRDKGFESSDERLAVALGRPPQEIAAMVEGSEEPDELNSPVSTTRSNLCEPLWFSVSLCSFRVSHTLNVPLRQMLCPKRPLSCSGGPWGSSRLWFSRHARLASQQRPQFLN